MDIVHCQQVAFDDVYSTEIDLVIAVSGYERRSPYLMERIRLGNETRLVLAFKEKSKEMNRPENDRKFHELGFDQISLSGNDGLEVDSLLEYLPEKNNKELNILVDYSCMTKTWYSSFIEYFTHASLPYKKVKVLFSYTQSEFTEPKKPRPLRVAESLGLGPRGMMAGKPLALVMGLGYEKDRAEFLRKSMQADKTFCLYADPCSDNRFVEKVYINNFKLIDSLHKNQVYNYPMEDMEKTNRILTDLCLELRMNYRIILAPLGPKPFSLICMLLVAGYPDIEIWRVSAGKSESNYDRIPLGEPLVYRVEFGNDMD